MLLLPPGGNKNFFINTYILHWRVAFWILLLYKLVGSWTSDVIRKMQATGLKELRSDWKWVECKQMQANAVKCKQSNAIRGRQAGSHSLKWPPSTLLPQLSIPQIVFNTCVSPARQLFHLPRGEASIRKTFIRLQFHCCSSHAVIGICSQFYWSRHRMSSIWAVGGTFSKSSFDCTILLSTLPTSVHNSPKFKDILSLRVTLSPAAFPLDKKSSAKSVERKHLQRAHFSRWYLPALLPARLQTYVQLPECQVWSHVCVSCT